MESQDLSFSFWMKSGFLIILFELHVKKLLSEGVLVREKIASEDPGRPEYVYAVSPKVKKQVRYPFRPLG